MWWEVASLTPQSGCNSAALTVVLKCTAAALEFQTPAVLKLKYMAAQILFLFSGKDSM